MNAEAPKFCSVCESALRPGAEFCSKCGGPARTIRVPNYRPPVSDEEPEIAPPPPPTGKTLTWQRNAKAGLRPADGASEDGVRNVGASAAGGPASPSPQSRPSSAPPLQLPAPSPPWPFRQGLVDLSAKISHAVTDGIGQKGKPAAAVVERFFQGAFCHPTIYRRAAESPGWTQEAALLVAAVMLATTLGFVVYLFSAYGPGFFFILKTMFVRGLAFLAVVLAIQIAAKSMHQIDIPYEPWFRALAYSQAANALAAVPVVGFVIGLWGLVCAVAAIMDVSGTDVAKAAILLLIGGLSAGLFAIVVTWFVI